MFGVGYRFIPRHEDELEMEADDPLLMEMQAEDLWCEAYNMRTGSKGIFPAFYAVKVTKDNQPKGIKCFSKRRFKKIYYYFKMSFSIMTLWFSIYIYFFFISRGKKRLVRHILGEIPGLCSSAIS